MLNIDNKQYMKTSDRYRINSLNLSNSPVSHEMARLDSDRYNGGRNRDVNKYSSRNMRNGRNGRNEEIHNINKNNVENQQNMNSTTVNHINRNDILVYIADLISGSVSVMYISLFVMFIINKNIKWFYILIFVLIINICTIIFKIFLMRFDYSVLYRPSQCIDEHKLLDFLHNSFILEGVMKKIDVEQYKKYGLPSVHVTTATSILMLTYLYFPKYKQLTLKLGIIYTLLLSISRMYLKCHTLLQIIVGLIFGIFSANVAYKLFN